MKACYQQAAYIQVQQLRLKRFHSWYAPVCGEMKVYYYSFGIRKCSVRKCGQSLP